MYNQIVLIHNFFFSYFPLRENAPSWPRLFPNCRQVQHRRAAVSPTHLPEAVAVTLHKTSHCLLAEEVNKNILLKLEKNINIGKKNYKNSILCLRNSINSISQWTKCERWEFERNCKKWRRNDHHDSPLDICLPFIVAIYCFAVKI